MNSLACTNNSVWTASPAYRPFDQQITPLIIKVNFIFWLHETTLPDGTKGNFEETNASHMLFIDLIIEEMNRRISHLVNPNNNSCDDSADNGNNYLSDAKIKYDVKKYFIPSSYHWNIQNATDNTSYCPGSWNNTYNTSALTLLQQHGVREGINVFFANEGNAYYDLLIDQTTTNYNATASNTDCSQFPSSTNLGFLSRVAMTNEFLAYRFANVIANNFSLDNKFQVARIILHELGHSLNLGHTTGSPCPENIMFGDPSSQLNYLTPTQMGRIHQSLHLYSVRKYICCELPGVVPRVLTGNHVWAFDTKLYTDLILEPGATLTLCGKLYMPKEGKIIVNRGAKLILDGGLISLNREEYDDCPDEYWNGVYVLGNPDKEHANVDINNLQSDDPGVMIISNEGIVERARSAVNLQHWNKYLVYANGGGILQANKATFRNNVRSVRFSSYSFLNSSSFNECLFISTDGTAEQGVAARSVRGISFQKCTFENMGKEGILLYGAQASITNGCLFKGMINGHGIYVIYDDPFGAVTQIGTLDATGTTRNKFENNYCGVYVGGAYDVRVLGNDFLSNSFGLAVSGETSILSRNNTYNEHIISENYDQSGANAFNETLCNTFTDAGYGLRFLGNNFGMTFNGNDFKAIGGTSGNPNIDVFLGDQTVEGQMTLGRLRNQGSFIRAADNSFKPSAGLDLSKDIFASSGSTQTFFYFHPNDGSKTPSCSINAPSGCSVVYNFYTVDGIEGETPCSNPSPPFGEDCKNKDCLDAFYEVIDSLNTFFDGGDKAGLLSAISDNPAASGTRNDLLAASPYLSDEILLALLTSTMASGDKKDVLLSNAPLEEAILQAASESLNAHDYQAVVATQSVTLSARGQLEDEIKKAVLRKQEALFHLSSQYVLAGNFSDAEALLTSDGSLAALRALVFSKLRNGNLSGASSVLGQLPASNLEDEHFDLIAAAAIQLAVSDTVTLNSGLIAELITVAKSHSSLAGRAQALLYHTNEMTFLPELPEELQSLQAEVEETTPPETGFPLSNQRQPGLPSLKVYPIPAENQLWVRGVNIDLPIPIDILDLHGHAVHQSVLLSGEDFAISIAALPAGIYVLRWLDTSGTHAMKVVVNH